MLLGFVVSDHCFPQAMLEVKVYRRLSDTSLGLMRKEAEAFSEVRGDDGLAVSSRNESERYFLLQANGEPVMLADSSSMQLVVMVAGDEGGQVPDLPDLQQQ